MRLPLLILSCGREEQRPSAHIKMIPEVYPISIPAIDWRLLLGATTEVLGRSPSRSIDHYGIGIKDSPALAYIAVLAAMSDENADASQILRRCPRSVLNHLSFGFLIVPDSVPVARHLAACVSIHLCNGCMVATGTLKNWVEILSDLQYDSDDINNETRAAFNKIFLLFEQLGLRDLWSDYRKVELPYSTFKLVKNARN